MKLGGGLKGGVGAEHEETILVTEVFRLLRQTFDVSLYTKYCLCFVHHSESSFLGSICDRVPHISDHLTLSLKK